MKLLFQSIPAIALAALTTAAFCQDAVNYPGRPIRMIVPFAPGGGLDISSRLIGQKLTEKWGQKVVVDSRPGAATIVGTEIAAKSAPDGYTMLIDHDDVRHQSRPLFQAAVAVARLDHIDIWPAPAALHTVRPGHNASRAYH
jgi:tripartite-type tricarboxylate transporter receptor subunit TctC